MIADMLNTNSRLRGLSSNAQDESQMTDLNLHDDDGVDQFEGDQDVEHLLHNSLSRKDSKLFKIQSRQNKCRVIFRLARIPLLVMVLCLVGMTIFQFAVRSKSSSDSGSQRTSKYAFLFIYLFTISV